MKFLLDAQLPIELKEIFVHHDVIHTSELPSGNTTKDHDINVISVSDERVVITKDNDFYYSYIASKKPYKLILVQVGNLPYKLLIEYFSLNYEKIVSSIRDNSFIILEKNSIRIME